MSMTRPTNRASGDKVEIMETRRLSKTKTWRLIKIVAKAPEQAPTRPPHNTGA